MSTARAQRCVCRLQRGVCDRACMSAAAGSPHCIVGLRLAGRRCVVVGGGKVALDKVWGLLACGAEVTVVAPQVVARLEDLEREGRVHVRRRRYEPGDTDGAFLVVAATDDLDVNLAVYASAASGGALVNVVNAPMASDFLVPAVVRTEALTIAISTTGASPALARRLKREIAEQYTATPARN